MVLEDFAELAPFSDRSVELEALVGQQSGAPQLSPHAVNAPMIRQWVDAMGDANPIYVSDRAARAYGHEGIVAPPAMLQVWIMPGLRDSNGMEAADATEGAADAYASMSALLDEEGLTGVRGTNCTQHYGRSLGLGDRLFARSYIESISDPTRTRLGPGRFITTRFEFTAMPDAGVPEAPSPSEIEALAVAGDPVAVMRFRILRYLPSDAAGAANRVAPAPVPAPASSHGAGLMDSSLSEDRTSVTFFDVAVGDELSALVLPITRTLIVLGAMAAHDYRDGHHDPDAARAHGAPDIFMDILTTNGLVGRYATDWSGPRSRVSQVDIRLGAPNYPGSVMTLTGTVTAKGPLAADGESGLVTVAVRGTNDLGDHVTGTVEVVLPMESAD
jgi:acyl dehydratase